jgi:AcrR family transcriptional regulator
MESHSLRFCNQCSFASCDELRTLHDMDAAAPGLRERKKQRTRETIIQAAMTLFAERGFDQTTIADIAAKADIAPRTFFGYFAAKEDVVFHDFDETRRRFEQRLADRPAGETTVEALRAVIAELVGELDFEDPAERLRRAVIASTPALQTRDRALMGEFEQILADSVARDLGVPAGSVRPRMVAAAAVAALTALEGFYQDPSDPGKKPLIPAEGEPMAVVEELLTFLRGGITALAGQPPPPTPPGDQPPDARVNRST